MPKIRHSRETGTTLAVWSQVEMRLGQKNKGAAGAPVVVVLDQAGWQKSQALKVPRNISLLSLPPRSPELILIGPAVRHHDLPIDPWRHIHGPPALTSVTVIAWGMLSG